MSHQPSDTQRAWELTCSSSITSDVIWKLDAYRASLYLLHAARHDCRILRRKQHADAVVSQLLHAAGSVSANLAEGYSRSTRNDRLRFFGYALGSVRECLTWYEAARGALTGAVIDDRLLRLSRIRSLLLGLIRLLRASPTAPFER
jgi:four helix bundle protein